MSYVEYLQLQFKKLLSVPTLKQRTINEKTAKIYMKKDFRCFLLVSVPGLEPGTT